MKYNEKPCHQTREENKLITRWQHLPGHSSGAWTSVIVGLPSTCLSLPSPYPFPLPPPSLPFPTRPFPSSRLLSLPLPSLFTSSPLRLHPPSFFSQPITFHCPLPPSPYFTLSSPSPSLLPSLPRLSLRLFALLPSFLSPPFLVTFFVFYCLSLLTPFLLLVLPVPLSFPLLTHFLLLLYFMSL